MSSFDATPILVILSLLVIRVCLVIYTSGHEAWTGTNGAERRDGSRS